MKIEAVMANDLVVGDVFVDPKHNGICRILKITPEEEEWCLVTAQLHRINKTNIPKQQIVNFCLHITNLVIRISP